MCGATGTAGLVVRTSDHHTEHAASTTPPAHLFRRLPSTLSSRCDSRAVRMRPARADPPCSPRLMEGVRTLVAEPCSRRGKAGACERRQGA